MRLESEYEKITGSSQQADAIMDDKPQTQREKRTMTGEEGEEFQMLSWRGTATWG